MLTVNTNTTSLITQLNLSKSNNLVKTSIERMSTGFKINRASDDAANMSISKNMDSQISGTDIAIDNANQATNLLGTADNALDNMQSNLLKIRNYTVQAMNGTYSAEEKAVIQGEIEKLLSEIYKQRNVTTFNQIRVFGDIEEMPVENINLGSTIEVESGTHPVTKLTEEEAIAQGYTCIHNEAEFVSMVSDGKITGKYCLMGDIDFSLIEGWENVQIQSGSELNGNGYSVNNLTINSTINPSRQALFWRNYGKIKNLNLNNININTNNSYIAGLLGDNYGCVENCSVFGNIKGGNRTGGLVANNDGGIITDCSSLAIVTGKDYTGGLVGYNNNGTVTNCSYSGIVTGNGYTGGLIGYHVGNSETLTDCYSSGTVTGTGICVGGLIGSANNTTITNCSSSATVTGTSNYVGGLVGYNSGTITDSSYSGNVTGNGNYIGGLAGFSSTINNCSSSGNVTGVGSYTGGLTGYCSGTITNCSSCGIVKGTGNYTGGLAGYSSVKIDKSYSTCNVSGNDYVGGLAGSGGKTSNSYAIGNVSGNDKVGGLAGHNRSNTSESYATGTVTGTGSNVGGFTGQNGTNRVKGNISNSYTTSNLNFYGNNLNGTISDCHGTKNQEGVTGHDELWFENSNNLSFLGEEFDTRYDPPELKSNSRGAKIPVKTLFQIGTNSGKVNTITIDTGFSLNQLTANIMTQEAAEKTLNDIDKMLKNISSTRSNIGSTQNRVDSISEFLVTYKDNMEASQSTIMNTDYATETTKLVKNQILQYVALSLLAQANTNQNIALMLLK